MNTIKVMHREWELQTLSNLISRGMINLVECKVVNQRMWDRDNSRTILSAQVPQDSHIKALISLVHKETARLFRNQPLPRKSLDRENQGHLLSLMWWVITLEQTNQEKEIFTILSLLERKRNGKAMSLPLHSKIDFPEKILSQEVLEEVGYMVMRMKPSNGNERQTWQVLWAKRKKPQAQYSTKLQDMIEKIRNFMETQSILLLLRKVPKNSWLQALTGETHSKLTQLQKIMHHQVLQVCMMVKICRERLEKLLNCSLMCWLTLMILLEIKEQNNSTIKDTLRFPKMHQMLIGLLRQHTRSQSMLVK